MSLRVRMLGNKFIESVDRKQWSGKGQQQYHSDRWHCKSLVLPTGLRICISGGGPRDLLQQAIQGEHGYTSNH